MTSLSRYLVVLAAARSRSTTSEVALCLCLRRQCHPCYFLSFLKVLILVTSLSSLHSLLPLSLVISLHVTLGNGLGERVYVYTRKLRFGILFCAWCSTLVPFQSTDRKYTEFLRLDRSPHGLILRPNSTSTSRKGILRHREFLLFS
jgi:hypothetical protein